MLPVLNPSNRLHWTLLSQWRHTRYASRQKNKRNVACLFTATCTVEAWTLGKSGAALSFPWYSCTFPNSWNSAHSSLPICRLAGPCCESGKAKSKKVKRKKMQCPQPAVICKCWPCIYWYHTQSSEIFFQMHYSHPDVFWRIATETRTKEHCRSFSLFFY